MGVFLPVRLKLQGFYTDPYEHFGHQEGDRYALVQLRMQIQTHLHAPACVLDVQLCICIKTKCRRRVPEQSRFCNQEFLCGHAKCALAWRQA